MSYINRGYQRSHRSVNLLARLRNPQNHNSVAPLSFFRCASDLASLKEPSQFPSPVSDVDVEVPGIQMHNDGNITSKESPGAGSLVEEETLGPDQRFNSLPEILKRNQKFESEATKSGEPTTSKSVSSAKASQPTVQSPRSKYKGTLTAARQTLGSPEGEGIWHKSGTQFTPENFIRQWKRMYNYDLPIGTATKLVRDFYNDRDRFENLRARWIVKAKGDPTTDGQLERQIERFQLALKSEYNITISHDEAESLVRVRMVDLSRFLFKKNAAIIKHGGIPKPPQSKNDSDLDKMKRLQARTKRYIGDWKKQYNFNLPLEAAQELAEMKETLDHRYKSKFREWKERAEAEASAGVKVEQSVVLDNGTLTDIQRLNALARKKADDTDGNRAAQVSRRKRQESSALASKEPLAPSYRSVAASATQASDPSKVVESSAVDQVPSLTGSRSKAPAGPAARLEPTKSDPSSVPYSLPDDMFVLPFESRPSLERMLSRWLWKITSVVLSEEERSRIKQDEELNRGSLRNVVLGGEINAQEMESFLADLNRKQRTSSQSSIPSELNDGNGVWAIIPIPEAGTQSTTPEQHSITYGPGAGLALRKTMTWSTWRDFGVFNEKAGHLMKAHMHHADIKLKSEAGIFQLEVTTHTHTPNVPKRPPSQYRTASPENKSVGSVEQQPSASLSWIKYIPPPGLTRRDFLLAYDLDRLFNASTPHPRKTDGYSFPATVPKPTEEVADGEFCGITEPIATVHVHATNPKIQPTVGAIEPSLEPGSPHVEGKADIDAGPMKVLPASAPAKPTRRTLTLKPTKAAITLTPPALTHLRHLLSSPSNPRLIRISVKSRGCAGLSYHLEYVAPPGGKFDEVVEQDGVKVLIDSKALFSIIGSEMDWVEDRLSAKFVFKNPNIKDSCGCGESFVV